MSLKTVKNLYPNFQKPSLKNSRLHAWNLPHLFVYLFIFNLFVVDKFYFNLLLE